MILWYLLLNLSIQKTQVCRCETTKVIRKYTVEMNYRGMTLDILLYLFVATDEIFGKRAHPLRRGEIPCKIYDSGEGDANADLRG
jgi:hypothetical protein